MANPSPSELPPHARAVSDHERDQHREFILQHIDFVSEVLAAEQHNRLWSDPAGCPIATPALTAHRRDRDGSCHECIYQRIETLSEESEESVCPCNDPLAGGDDPLDTVAAAVLSESDSPEDLYFDHQVRTLVAQLREEVGNWCNIAALDSGSLLNVCDELPARNVAPRRIRRLDRALTQLSAHRYVDELNLLDLPAVKYKNLQEMFRELPGISSQTAWWLVLVALDKPVWPAAPGIDRLLMELGLLAPAEYDESAARHGTLEAVLTPRQILPLHRMLAAHVRYCGPDHADASCELRRFTLGYRHTQQQVTQEGPVVIDLFAGAGGLSSGFSRQGFEIALSIDKNEHATDTYRLNHPDVPHTRVRCEKISDFLENATALEELNSDVDVVVGGPPCQALSKAGFRARRSNDDDYTVLQDSRTDLYKQYISILEEVEPDIVVMENVTGILSEIGDTGCRIIEDVEAALDSAGYEADYRTVGCSNYRIPQSRNRVLVIGINRTEFEYPAMRVAGLFADLQARSHDGEDRSLRQALSNLPRIRRGEGADVTAGRARGRASDYVRTHDLGADTRLVYNHQARRHPMEKDRELFDEVLDPGDTGWDAKYRKGRDDLIDYDVGTEANPAFKDKYRMLEWSEPAPTIVAHLAKDSNSFILPDYYDRVIEDASRTDRRRNRGITPREAARIQSFPDAYVFLGPFTAQFRQIGNAVPPVLGEYLADTVSRHLVDAPEASTSGTVSPRAAGSDD